MAREMQPFSATLTRVGFSCDAEGIQWWPDTDRRTVRHWIREHLGPGQDASHENENRGFGWFALMEATAVPAGETWVQVEVRPHQPPDHTQFAEIRRRPNAPEGWIEARTQSGGHADDPEPPPGSERTTNLPPSVEAAQHLAAALGHVEQVREEVEALRRLELDELADALLQIVLQEVDRLGNWIEDALDSGGVTTEVATTGNWVDFLYGASQKLLQVPAGIRLGEILGELAAELVNASS